TGGGPGAARGAAPARPRLLERLVLHRPETRAWALYDVANSALFTTVIAAVFPVYFAKVVAAELEQNAATTGLTRATTIALVAVALVAPVLGGVADVRAWRKRLLAVFSGIGVLATAGLATVGAGDVATALVCFALANLGAAGSIVFYDALLPHLAREGEVDRLSTSGFALGYLGGGLLLALNLAWIQRPDLFGLPHGEGLTPGEATLPTRLAFLSVAVWWALFTLPLLRRVPEPPPRLEADETQGEPALRAALRRLRETFRELYRYRQAFWMMLAFLVYNDGILTIIRFATYIGAQRDFDDGVLIGSILLVQFVGVPFAVLFGRLAGAIGPKRSVLLGIGAYFGITLLAYWMHTSLHFLALAVAVGTVQGGTQALSRSLFASLVPKHKSGEFFGLFAVLEKFAGILGPLVFGIVAAASPPDDLGRPVLAILPFFAVGGLLLLRVDVDAGRRAARAAERELQGVA
ncbi:MAG TPA: MFS transporter, partial [Planctomycetota bacterium]|nr:MFS transporter [Planctomycetota bacterium]